jgi:hypothetical protein
MKLNAPKKLTFLIALILAGVSLAGVFITIPFISVYAFWILLVAFCVLTAGCVLKGF